MFSVPCEAGGNQLVINIRQNAKLEELKVISDKILLSNFVRL